MKDQNFIITAAQLWDTQIGSAIKNMALEISKQNKVLFVNSPLDISTRLHAVLKSARKQTQEFEQRMAVLKGKRFPLRCIRPNLWVVDCPFTLLPVSKLPTPIFECVNRYNNYRIGHYILQQAELLGFKKFIHLIDNDLFRSLHLKQIIKPKYTVYYRRDNFIGVPYWSKHGRHCEEYIVRNADAVIANSILFANELKSYNANVHFVPMGIDLDIYDASINRNIPTDLLNITSPIIGYTGAILESRLDASLLYQAAECMPEYSFVLVGPEDRYFKEHLLHNLSNVHFLGSKQVEQLPDYIQAFDVCINPQKVNDITNGNYPLKIDEYLAMGKPVVATSTYTMREAFAPYTHLATNVDEFVNSLRIALRETNDSKLREQRIAFAHTHSWKNSVEQIYNVIEETEKDI
ncbi:MAG: glycosyltransferase [Prevotellaceae bacterium]|jgi:glycosyltransferase involved in cell wall biosynthesis|nr:glycosyltransferase [Prevotellaceae bacterium]